ncbi:hypothetical protein PROFUN_16706, partial [Planoprotostelium fungivorum]
HANAYKCFAEDYQTEHRRQAFNSKTRQDQLSSLSCLDNFPQKVMRTISENFERYRLSTPSIRAKSLLLFSFFVKRPKCDLENVAYNSCLLATTLTTNLNTKREPILNKSHDSMQVVVKMRQWIYFSGLSSILGPLKQKGGPVLHQMGSNRERVLDRDAMDLPMISQPGLRGHSRGERDESLLLTNLRFFLFSGRHVTSLCHNLQCLCSPPSLLLVRGLAKVLSETSWDKTPSCLACVLTLRQRLCQNSPQDKSISAGPYDGFYTPVE